MRISATVRNAVDVDRQWQECDRPFIVTDAKVDRNTFGLVVPEHFVATLNLTRVAATWAELPRYSAVRLSVMDCSCAIDVEVDASSDEVIIGRLPLLALGLKLETRCQELIEDEWLCPSDFATFQVENNGSNGQGSART